uniref:Transmembrane protein n=1 Tax=Parastrongyloides trichosuri TaxID=131310 RepID=A0A0N4ZSZ0_PARTI
MKGCKKNITNLDLLFKAGNNLDMLLSEVKEPHKIVQRRFYKSKKEALTKIPINFDCFFNNPSTKNINKRPKYYKHNADTVSTIITKSEPTEHRTTKMIVNQQTEDITTICNNQNTLPNVVEESYSNYRNESLSHMVEAVRNCESQYKEEHSENDHYNEKINVNSNNVSEVEIHDSDGYDDVIINDEKISPKRLNILKKMDVKTCVWIFLSYAFLDTFIAVYYACTPLQMAFIAMSMGSLLFYKYT